MDDKTFDTITKVLGSGADRRRVLSGLVGGAFASVLGLAEAEQKGKRSRRKSSRRTKRRDRDDNAPRRPISAAAAADCDAVCPLVEGIAGQIAGEGCQQFCSELRRLEALLLELVKQNLITGDQMLQLLGRLFEDGIIRSANEFRRLLMTFVRDRLFVVCEGNLLRICISRSGEIACCDRGQPCANGICRCPPRQVRCGGRCLRCGQGQVLDEETCECRCSNGGELCNGECYAPCPSRLTRDPVTCACACPPIHKGCCVSDDQCGDSNVCTEDSCDLATHLCVNRPIDGCCRRDDECATNNPCTLDSCTQSTHTCAHDAIVGCCRDDNVCGPCETCSADNTCMADRARDGTSCAFDGGEGTCCDGNCAVCSEGEPLDLETCGCGGGDGCACTKADVGDSCEGEDECCSNVCGFDEDAGHHVCQRFEESRCTVGGGFCSNNAAGENDCCSTFCQNCVCSCRDLGDAACRNDSECCGRAACAPDGCCLEPGVLCSANSECCSASCEDFPDDGNRYCACGAVGTPCTNGTHCCSQICGPEGVCACSQPEDSTLDCREDSDCCGGRCKQGLQAPNNGADGFCCRFEGRFCRFDFECCSGSCNETASACT